MRSFDVFVDAKLPKVKFEARDSCELAREKRALRAIGESVTFESGTKMPWFGAHTKYLRESWRLKFREDTKSYRRLLPGSTDTSVVLAVSLLELNSTPDSRSEVRLSNVSQRSETAACRRLDNDSIVDFQRRRCF